MPILKIILISVFLFIVISIFLNKNFFDDTLDFANNLFQPPDIDPIEADREVFRNRQDAIDVTTSWARAYITAIDSNEPACYIDLPPMTSDIIEEEYVLELTSIQKDKTIIQLKRAGFPATDQKQLDTSLCLIVEKKDSQSNILQNFKENLVDKYEPDNCIEQNKCAKIIIQTTSNTQTDEDDSTEILISGEKLIFQTPNPDETSKNKKTTSMKLTHLQVSNQNEEITLSTTTNSLSTQQSFRLIKIHDDICLLPIDSSTSAGWVYNSVGELKYLKQNAILYNSEYTGTLPSCTANIDELTQYESQIINIVFTTIRPGRRQNNINHPVMLEYTEQKWNIQYPPTGRPSNSEEDEHIMNHLEEILSNKNYAQGVIKLCNEFILNTKITIDIELPTGQPGVKAYTITNIEGLRCDLAPRV